jgi:arylsulfatase
LNGVPETREQVLDSPEVLGGPETWAQYPAGWALAMDTPFQWTKQVASHLGGTRNPMIVKWPAKFQHGGEIRTQFTHVIDVVPTILAAAGIPEPRSVNGTAQTPMNGRSFLHVLEDAKAPEFRTSQYFEIFSNRGMYKDGWWAASLAFEPWESERGAFETAHDEVGALQPQRRLLSGARPRRRTAGEAEGVEGALVGSRIG